MNDYIEIELIGGGVAKVDRDAWRAVKGYDWRPFKSGKYTYAACHAEGTTLLMHRLLADATEGQVVMHLNRDRLDNRRKNLHVTTRALAGRRREVNKTSKTRQRGVMTERRSNGSLRYRAVVVVNKKRIRKWFTDADAAARWATEKRVEVHGEAFA